MPIIQSVERALKILDLFDEYTSELKITEISQQMNMNKSTVHSLLKTLQKHHYIQQDEANGKYKLGLKLFERGNLALLTLDIRSVARKYLIELSRRTGHTLHLVVLDGKEGVYIDKIEGTSGPVRHSKIGRRAPIHSTGVGKALAAFIPEEELNKLLIGYVFEKRTENTILTQFDYLQELEKIREKGYAIDAEENEPGITCLAVPIRDMTRQVIAAFSISMPTPQMNEQSETIVSLMSEAGNKISKELGFKS